MNTVKESAKDRLELYVIPSLFNLLMMFKV